ncbi:hypothetical protein NMY22_g16952 [Coprinellus aureogranulatus]|nr:hypothetical protein NMY22_g16952 [Coprinellus aureogranulatus]
MSHSTATRSPLQTVGKLSPYYQARRQPSEKGCHSLSLHPDDTIVVEYIEAALKLSIEEPREEEQSVAVDAPSTNDVAPATQAPDPPASDLSEDAQEGMVEDIMDWLTNRDTPTRVLCLTGAAGAGKTALRRIIEVECTKKGILTVSFTFSKSDTLRNSAQRLVPSIAFQLGSRDVRLRELITDRVKDDPLVFRKSVTHQVETLNLDPMKRLRDQDSSALEQFPHVVLIDAVDECKVQDQPQVLLVIRKLVESSSSTPFRIFVTSRPEPVIQEALEPWGSLRGLVYPMQLGGEGDMTRNIRRMLQRKLLELQVLPADRDLDRVVESASAAQRAAVDYSVCSSSSLIPWLEYRPRVSFGA